MLSVCFRTLCFRFALLILCSHFSPNCRRKSKLAMLKTVHHKGLHMGLQDRSVCVLILKSGHISIRTGPRWPRLMNQSFLTLYEQIDVWALLRVCSLDLGTYVAARYLGARYLSINFWCLCLTWSELFGAPLHPIFQPVLNSSCCVNSIINVLTEVYSHGASLHTCPEWYPHSQ